MLQNTFVSPKWISQSRHLIKCQCKYGSSLHWSQEIRAGLQRSSLTVRSIQSHFFFVCSFCTLPTENIRTPNFSSFHKQEVAYDQTLEGKSQLINKYPRTWEESYFFYYPRSHDKGYYHEIIIPLEQYKTGDTADCYHAHGMWLAHGNSIPWTQLLLWNVSFPPFSIYK